MINGSSFPSDTILLVLLIYNISITCNARAKAVFDTLYYGLFIEHNAYNSMQTFIKSNTIKRYLLAKV